MVDTDTAVVINRMLAFQQAVSRASTLLPTTSALDRARGYLSSRSCRQESD
jgi:hypothetical protein